MSTAPTDCRPHPAKYNDDILVAIASHLAKGWKVLDPMAGVGRVHDLADLVGCRTWGVELELEWASQHDRTVCWDARDIATLWPEPGSFDAIVTSPAYGNRMADQYDGRDGSRRHTYRIDLGRPLTEGSGAALQWGAEYRRLHAAIWDAVVPLASQRVILNIKNHIRGDKVQRVAEWHTRYLIGAHGLELDAIEPVPASGVQHGANAAARVDHELVLVFTRPAAEQVTLWGDVTP
jgi:hypothetical protein